jgi:tRNA dimethylallyltransferase
MEPRIWLIAGPTASGKSALALRLARQIGGEIVNADALQLYADLRALSARPTPEEESQAPHHLFGTVDGAEAWSVGRWLRAASGLIETINGRGRPAILVGGTGLYFRALTEGLADVPPIPADVRAAEEARFDAEGETAARDRLRVADPAAEARIAPGDRLRLTRALEVLAATGKPISTWQAETRGLLAPDEWRGLALEPPRDDLYARCDARLTAMLDAGALEEVAALTARSLDPRLPVMKAVGVREFAAHLVGDLTLDQALDDARRETRRYAKRQLTWLRNQMAHWPRAATLDPEVQWMAIEAAVGG